MNIELNHGGGCPRCGYCDKCGRGGAGYWWNQYWGGPIWQIPPQTATGPFWWYGGSTATGTSTTNTGSVGL